MDPGTPGSETVWSGSPGNSDTQYRMLRRQLAAPWTLMSFGGLPSFAPVPLRPLPLVVLHPHPPFVLYFFLCNPFFLLSFGATLFL